MTDDLPWKKVSKPREADLGTGMDGFLELEEVDDVDIVFEETDTGRVVKFKVCLRVDVSSRTCWTDVVHQVREEEDGSEDGTEDAREIVGESSAVTTEKVDVDALPQPVEFNSEYERGGLPWPA